MNKQELCIRIPGQWHMELSKECPCCPQIFGEMWC